MRKDFWVQHTETGPKIRPIGFDTPPTAVPLSFADGKRAVVRFWQAQIEVARRAISDTRALHIDDVRGGA